MKQIDFSKLLHFVKKYDTYENIIEIFTLEEYEYLLNKNLKININFNPQYYRFYFYKHYLKSLKEDEVNLGSIYDFKKFVFLNYNSKKYIINNGNRINIPFYCKEYFNDIEDVQYVDKGFINKFIEIISNTKNDANHEIEIITDSKEFIDEIIKYSNKLNIKINYILKYKFKDTYLFESLSEYLIKENDNINDIMSEFVKKYNTFYDLFYLFLFDNFISHNIPKNEINYYINLLKDFEINIPIMNNSFINLRYLNDIEYKENVNLYYFFVNGKMSIIKNKTTINEIVDKYQKIIYKI